MTERYGYQHFPYGVECWHDAERAYLKCDRAWRRDVGLECMEDLHLGNPSNLAHHPVSNRQPATEGVSPT